MEPEFSELKVLVELGLTFKQARVYLALTQCGDSKIMDISRIAKVARPDVYGTLEKLQRLGLVEKLLVTPSSYRAVPIKEGLALLLETTTERYMKVKAQTELLRNTTAISKPKGNGETDSPQFILIPEGTIVLDRIRAAIERAQRNIDVAVTWHRFSQGIIGDFGGSIEKARAKGVTTRLLVEKPPKNTTSKQLIQFYKEKVDCQIRFIRERHRTVFSIYDKSEVFLTVFTKSDLPKSPALWSNNHALVSLVADHFEALWREADECL